MYIDYDNNAPKLYDEHDIYGVQTGKLIAGHSHPKPGNSFYSDKPSVVACLSFFKKKNKELRKHYPSYLDQGEKLYFDHIIEEDEELLKSFKKLDPVANKIKELEQKIAALKIDKKRAEDNTIRNASCTFL